MSDTIKAALEEAVVLRVQDRAGRGPFRPGVTDRWRDLEGQDFPPVQQEFGLAWRDEVPAGWHCGCAFRNADQLSRWFSAHECWRLNAIGYRVARISARILRESPHQLLIVRARPFRECLLVPWPHMAKAALDPWKLAAAVERAAKGGGDGR